MSAVARPTGADGVWRLPNYRRLWWGNAVSTVGSQVTMNALPLIAVLVLGATGTQVGLLRALYTVPFLLLTLPAGVWLERRARRPVMLGTDVARAILVLTVPVCAWVGVLGWPQVYAVVAVGGALTVVSELAAVAYLPPLVGPFRLAEANSRMHASLAVSGTTAVGLTGWLATLVGPAPLLLLDAVSYVVSGAMLLRIRHCEPAMAAPGDRDPVAETREGLRAVFGHPVIRRCVVYATVFTVGTQLANVAMVVYLLADVHLGAALFGLTLMAGGVGGIVGTLAAPALLRRHGYGRTMLAGIVLGAMPMALVPVGHTPAVTVALTGVALLLGAAGACVTGSASVTLRHLLTPTRLHARMNASYRLVQFAAIPVCSVAAGALVDAIGSRPVLWLAPGVLLAAALPLSAGPVRRLGHQSPLADADRSMLVEKTAWASRSA
ncbi:MFS transporter [Micromonospora sp. NPDC048999]|uniref:MFS transporter n=1 Tax=Micromonospora sp. NPDC048999 TaxID=3155391 RepID=UPI0034064B9F